MREIEKKLARICELLQGEGYEGIGMSLRLSRALGDAGAFGVLARTVQLTIERIDHFPDEPEQWCFSYTRREWEKDAGVTFRTLATIRKRLSQVMGPKGSELEATPLITDSLATGNERVFRLNIDVLLALLEEQSRKDLAEKKPRRFSR